ncbi:ribonuclease P protein subunit p14-like [Orbicella faveolata]|uniref:ribonuclease P protein subunit p14-like n=1 Tax=Orbicella faveolata TaxID=48498 RepID=UPI0009E5E688|nr:ribonuclease P protein subunit p14-like [Orbicella faveolata]
MIQNSSEKNAEAKQVKVVFRKQYRHYRASAPAGENEATEVQSKQKVWNWDRTQPKSGFRCGVRVITKQIGSAIIVDVIKFDPVSMEVIVRVKERGLVKLWSALTLLSYYRDRKCAIKVIQVSPHLLSLAVDSRQWKTKEKESSVAS